MSDEMREYLRELSMWLCIGMGVGFAVLRFTLPSHGLNSQDIFKDLAHLFVGGMFGAFIASGKREYLLIGAALTAVEVVAAVCK